MFTQKYKFEKNPKAQSLLSYIANKQTFQLLQNHQRVNMCNLKAGVYLLFGGIFFSLISIIGVSTLDYPNSTTLVASGIIDLLTICFFTAAIIADKSMKLIKVAMFFAMISTTQACLFLISSLLMEYHMMTAFLLQLGVNSRDYSPELIRFSLFIAGVIWMLKTMFMLVGSYLLYKRAKKFGDIILWSHKDQGLYI